MKILLSAFACAPDRGSEPGVGWNWALELHRQGYDVTIYTHVQNRDRIVEKNLTQPKFVFIGKPGSKAPGNPLLHYIYYYYWQALLLFYLVQSREYKEFDVFHHLTYGGVRAGSFLWLLRKRFIFGPIGGGEIAPLFLVWPCGMKYYLKEFTRNILTYIQRWDINFILMQIFAERIFVKTSETEKLLMGFARRKSTVSVEIGAPLVSHEKEKHYSQFRVLFAGRLLAWKGVHIVKDVADALKDRSDIHFDVVGSGPLDSFFSTPAPNVTFHGPLTQENLFHMYRKSHFFFFPSLHDSSGNVLLEAMAHGLPVLCLSLGGPPVIVADGGVIIDVRDKNYFEVISEIADEIDGALRDAELYMSLSERATHRAEHLTWEAAVRKMYDNIKAVP